MVLVWLKFFICLVAIAIAGSKLSRYGDVIAEKTGLSGTWVGIVMLATVTSLPELVTGLSSVILADAPDIAVGSIFGSCVFNLSIIVLLDFIHRRESVFNRASRNLIITAAYGLVLIGFSAFGILLAAQGVPVIGSVGITTPIIVAIYVIAMRNIFAYERENRIDPQQEFRFYDHMTLSSAAIKYSVASVVVLGVGTWLPFVGEELGAMMGWHQTFVGSLFIALATSLPEVVVTIAAARMGALDMAIGNLFGSNLFNILIIAIADLAHPQGSLLADISSLHMISALSAMMMTGLAVLGIFMGTKKRPLKGVSWISLFLLASYLLNSYLLFQLDR